MKSVMARTGVTLLILLLWVLVFLFGAAAILFKGPSPAARDLLVSTVMETSAAKFVAKMFLSDAEIEEILKSNTIIPVDAQMDTNLIEIDIDREHTQEATEAIELHEVKGATYKGKMIIVQDPSRAYVATPAVFDSESGGLRVEEMVKRDQATVGINGGGFEDINGVGNGGKPIGFVIQNGVITYGTPESAGSVVAFDQENRLVVGRMKAKDALAKGIREAVTFDPVGPLIVNGEALPFTGSGGGLNPRTAIGQRKDGALLLLVIDGRQPHSIGASYKDLIEVMQNFGAMNAANLDGGSSSLMVYNGEIINVCASLYGSRKLPTAILVK